MSAKRASAVSGICSRARNFTIHLSTQTTIAAVSAAVIGVVAGAWLLRRKLKREAAPEQKKDKPRGPPSAWVIRAAVDEDLEEIKTVVNWSYRGKPFSAWTKKPSDLKESEKKSGWTGEQHLVRRVCPLFHASHGLLLACAGRGRPHRHCRAEKDHGGGRLAGHFGPGRQRGQTQSREGGRGR